MCLCPLKRRYVERRRQKEAATKVSFYERNYGFVPDNVMTEAEWRDARARAPKVKVPSLRPRPWYFGAGGAGAGFS